MPENILFYHKGCPDGFGAAYAFHLKFGDTMKYIPINHYEKLPEVSGKNVFFADISRPREILLKINDEAKSLLLLDHHISAYKKLKDLSFCRFDLNKSGAMMSWDYCFPKTSPGLFFKLLQEQDLYKFETINALDILAYINVHEFSFDVWKEVIENIDNSLHDVISKGRILNTYIDKLSSTASRNPEVIKLFGIEFMAVNAKLLRHEVANKLASEFGMGAAYYISDRGITFSLRSTTDCSVKMDEVASNYGGGGHECAAGFSVLSFDDL